MEFTFSYGTQLSLRPTAAYMCCMCPIVWTNPVNQWQPQKLVYPLLVVCLSHHTRWIDHFEDVRLPPNIYIGPSYYRKLNKNCWNNLFAVNRDCCSKSCELNDEKTSSGVRTIFNYKTYSWITCWKVTQVIVHCLFVVSVILNGTVTISLKSQSSCTGDTRQSWSIFRAPLLA